MRGLEEVLAREIGVSRQKVIAELVEAANLARELKEPSSLISAYRNVAQICGYYRQEATEAAAGRACGETVERVSRLSDQALVDLIEAGAIS